MTLTLLEVNGHANLTVLRIFRLVRITRLAKMLRKSQEVSLLIAGIVKGFQTVMWSFVLLGTVMFALAVLLRQNRETGKDEEVDETFSSVPATMLVIFRCTVLRSDVACSISQQSFYTTLSDEMGWLFKIPHDWIS